MIQLPKDPPPGLLMSMAIRYDHALGFPGYYDQPLFEATEPGGHKRRLESTLSIMRQLYEEVSGHGFYKPELEGNYVSTMKKELAVPIARLSIEGHECTNCGTVQTASLQCPGCGLADPPTRKPKKTLDKTPQDSQHNAS